ncbi:winged helix-turn-helix transcriptional regulator [Rubrobacter xylanophilus]|uniref:winged helix-turn-helix transcriptional regulator n=1 Tax=Rubrobacter xylanophilus TaxID=49319 RepID=UPI001C63F755|nr:winged helix-turn-helix transcriptional regulator [Rubrobacter xylanophilus]
MAEDRARRVFEVSGVGRLMVTRRAGREVREALEEALAGLPKGGVLYVDTRGVEMMDYSFADEALGILVSRVAAGEHGDRKVVLVEEDRDLLENVEASLRQRGLAMIRVPEPGGEPSVIGGIKDHLLETLQVIHSAGSITTAELAKRLGLNHTACNNRATNLFRLGLVGRRPGHSGRQYVYERIA